jgi:hypothetical protein
VSAPTVGTTVALLQKLWELHQRRGSLAVLSAHEQAEIRHALRWLGEQQATSLHYATMVPYALTRVTDLVAADQLAALQKADIRVLSDFAATLGPPTVTRGRR